MNSHFTQEDKDLIALFENTERNFGVEDLTLGAPGRARGLSSRGLKVGWVLLGCLIVGSIWWAYPIVESLYDYTSLSMEMYEKVILDWGDLLVKSTN